MGKFLLQAATLLLLINASNTTLEKNRLTTSNTKNPDSNNIYKEFKGTWCYEHGDVRLEVIIMAVKPPQSSQKMRFYLMKDWRNHTF